MDGDTASFLPEEIISNILIRLPVKTLIRFQCVSKQWKNLIKTPSFIQEHLRHSSDRNSCLLLQRNKMDDPMHLSLLNRELQVVEFLKTNYLSGARIIGSSNGLLCVDKDKYNIPPPSLLLWNPATREIREMPRRKTFDYFQGKYTVGFGFSPIAKDYKIVITYAFHFDSEVNQVEVYSLTTGLWKEIVLDNLEPVSLYWETITVNGAIFWTGLKVGVEEEYDAENVVVVSFDIAVEVFTIIPWPALENHSIDRLTGYDNKLAIISLTVMATFGPSNSLVELWVMEEGPEESGERWIWTKKYRSSFYPFYLDPTYLWRNYIVCHVPFGEVHNHEPKTSNQLKMLFISDHIYNIFNYVESLVPTGLQN